MKEELEHFAENGNFENVVVDASEEDASKEYTKDVNEIDLTNKSAEYNEPTLNPEPSNSPNTPVPNGFSTTLVFNHPDKINGCDIVNIAPMDYYKDMNKKLNQQNGEKIMNGGDFGEITGIDGDNDLYFLNN